MTELQNQIAIYQTSDGKIQIDVCFDQDTVWLRQEQMSELFGRERSVISKHIRNVFIEGELDEKSNVQNLHIAGSDKPVKFYSLDVIISIGYRVKSQRGTQFRIWANNILKQYLVQGYALNEEKLKAQQEKLADLKQAIALSSRLVQNKALSASESQGILAILEKYSHALTVLDDYDHQRLKVEGTQKAEHARITYDEAIQQIQLWRDREKLSDLFGNEKDESFKGSLETIYQTFGGGELYPSIEEKAANLLYFIVKNHSFTDGNKRIAAAIFVWFLERHDYLYNADGEKRIADNALVAFTLLIAESKPEEKDTIVKVIINLINGNNG
ncbi:filamentation induced by cAMP protein Fic [Methyloglobulus morosus KoM1]|uniref:Filamentation induced by cAMP protein Fic n=1 Tax=Methyloglobulus morosus KoM1 TaxID=1116472 RepID=V5DWW8_9GAMM|nr:virulence protein RhuM/Fic/DOC family protein [Methyloglobulus morosus]ESS71836.1 filamentation induced by cAMP protein Fic [Methyloglobulus morosus KoM1]